MDFDFALNRSSEERQVSIILERIGSLQEVVGSPHPTLPRCLALQRSDIVIGAWNHRVAFIQDPALAVSCWLDPEDLMTDHSGTLRVFAAKMMPIHMSKDSSPPWPPCISNIIRSTTLN